ncbi:MAG: type II toxin-antitoxin system RelE/ParE family toxin [Candidatus Pacebacteria bacterium]|nr:type II toxin-antitoxin system RelE/ParE family toxin [Candidatus Paceibacterota bacterium]
MAWEVLFVDYFEKWISGESDDVQTEVVASVELLKDLGPQLGRPYADTLRGSKYRNLKELRVQVHGDPYRVLYIFDVKRRAILLLGGNKKGNDRWYKQQIPLAEKLYEEYLKEEKENG